MSDWSGGEVGLMAVRAKYGREIEEHIRLWPDQALVYAIAEYRDDRKPPSDWDGRGPWESYVQAKVNQARENLQRAKRDKEYALAQAQGIAYYAHQLPQPLTTVPGVAEVRRMWGMEP